MSSTFGIVTTSSMVSLPLRGVLVRLGADERAGGTIRGMRSGHLRLTLLGTDPSPWFSSDPESRPGFKHSDIVCENFLYCDPAPAS